MPMFPIKSIRIEFNKEKSAIELWKEVEKPGDVMDMELLDTFYIGPREDILKFSFQSGNLVIDRSPQELVYNRYQMKDCRFFIKENSGILTIDIRDVGKQIKIPFDLESGNEDSFFCIRIDDERNLCVSTPLES